MIIFSDSKHSVCGSSHKFMMDVRCGASIQFPLMSLRIEIPKYQGALANVAILDEVCWQSHIGKCNSIEKAVPFPNSVDACKHSYSTTAHKFGGRLQT